MKLHWAIEPGNGDEEGNRTEQNYCKEKKNYKLSMKQRDT